MKMLQTFTYKHHGEEHSLNDFHYKDTGMLFNNLVREGHTPELGRVRCWLTSHEVLARQYVRYLPNEPVKIPQGWERVQGLCAVDGSWRIELPTSTAELKYWGETLSNCVGGYGRNINEGQSIVFVVYWQGTLKYCAEVNNNKRIAQFYGQRNSSPIWSEKDSVCYALEQAGLLDY
jgi:hypothetical protein